MTVLTESALTGNIPASAYIIAAAVAAGAAKEAYDATGRGCVEWQDFAATVAGGAAGFFCTFL